MAEQTNHTKIRKYLYMKIKTSDLYKSEYANDRAAYEKVLNERHGNKKRVLKSSTELSLKELNAFANYMCGKEDSHDAALRASRKQVKYMKDMWKQKARNPDDGALLNFVKRQTGKVYADVKHILRTDVRKVIPALEKM